MVIDIKELLAPIPGDDPAGGDASFSDQFDRIREARRADDPGLAQGDWQVELKVADWREAQRLAEDVLQRSSKDLQAAVWLCEALISRHGLPGAIDGFELLHGLLETYWDNLYPRADDGDLEERAGKLAWFASWGTKALQTMLLNDDPQAALTLAGWVDSREVDNLGRQNSEAYQTAIDDGRINGDTFDTRMLATPDDMVRERCEQAQQARDTFAKLSALSDAKLGRDAPNLAAIDDALKKIQAIYTRAASAKGMGGVVSTEADVSAEGDSAMAMPMGIASGTAGQAVALNLQGNSLASKEAALRALTDIAGFFRRTEPHSPVAYLLDRAVAWANMPLEEWLAEVVRDDSTLSSIRERVGLPSSY